MLIPFEYEYLSAVEPGIIWGRKTEKEKGYFLKERSYEFIAFPNQDNYNYNYIGEGYFSYSDKKKWGQGIFNGFEQKFVLKPNYSDLDRVRYGQVLVKQGKKGVGIYDLNKKEFVVKMGKYMDIWMPNTLSFFFDKHMKLGNIEEDSLFLATKLIDTVRYEYVILTNHGKERKISSGGNSKNGDFIINSDGFLGGCAHFSVNQIGCIDVNGDIIIHPSEKYTWIGRCTEGLIPIGKNEKRGFVDFEGNVIVPLIFSKVESFINGLAKVEQSVEGDDRLIKKGYIDRKGNWVWSTVETKKD